MALNSDFKVKDSLYVGSSACFVTQTDTPRILSAGTDLWDIFLQEDEISNSCTLTNGTGVNSFSFDTTADATINLNNSILCGAAQGNAQGQVAVTNLGSVTSQIDVNGLQTNDSPQFNNLCTTGNIVVDGTVDGRNIAADAAQLAILQGLSGDNGLTFSSGSQGSLSITQLDGDVTNIDLGTQTTDNPSFAGVTADNIQIGVTGTNEIDTTSGNLTLDSAGGTVIIDDKTTLCGEVTLGSGTVAGVSNTVLVSDGGVIKTDFIDSRVWGTTLVDGAGTASKVTLWSDGNTIGNSNITQDLNGDIQIAGGLSATATLSGDGSGLTGVTATAVNFPSVNKNDLDPLDKIFIQDNADGGNKFTSYGCLLSDTAGFGLAVTANTDSICIAGACALSNCTLPMWDSGNGCFLDTVITQSTAGDVNIAGGLTVMDNLSVMGTFTCLDTSVSTTSALSVINTGTGPAFYAEQTGVSQPIAKFVDTEGGQMVIGDTGNVGIGGSTDNPSEKLVVTGNIAVTGTVDGVDVSARDAQLAVLQGLSANNIVTGSVASQGTMRLTSQCGGDIDVDLGLQVTDSPSFAGLSITGVQAGTDNTVLVMDGNNVKSDEIDPKVWTCQLVDTASSTITLNNVPKVTNTNGTIGDSAITDSGTLVTIDSDTKIDSDHALQVYATGGSRYAEEKTFTSSVSNTATTVTTFNKTNLKSVKYEVTLVKGVNVTAFEIHAVYNGTGACGTTYAIVDAQTASQLVDVAIVVGTSTIDLEITAASTATTAVIHGVATY